MKKIIWFAFTMLVLAGCGDNVKEMARVTENIHRKILTVDTHCDTPMGMVETGYDLGQRHDKGCVDFPRMFEGGLDAEFFAVFTSQGPRNDSAYNEIYEYALEVMETIHDNVGKNSSMASIALTPDDAYRLKKEGRIAAFIGIENGYPVGKDLTRIREFYNRGARYITLAHTRNNDICDSSTDSAGPEHNGLSAFGREVISEMNRIGMMIDVSHISDKAFYDVLKLSKAPVIASHSSCRALCESPRNLSDDMLLALRDNMGVIQICILSDYLKTPDPNPELDEKITALREKYGDYQNLSEKDKEAYRAERWEIRERYKKLATVKDVVDHIDHVVQVAGIDHVGIGTDFDGGGGVEGCKSVADMKNITIELLQRGYSRAEIEKIWGGNFMRVFRQAQEMREKEL